MIELKLGDIIEVMEDYPNGTFEKRGARLIVTDIGKYMTLGKEYFMTNSTANPERNAWIFTENHITNGALRIITLSNSIAVSLISPASTVMNSIKENKVPNICECGAASVKDHMHSSWCPAYNPTWKDA